MAIFRELERIDTSDIRVYGHIDRSELDSILGMTTFVLMPSLFLETFGLVALETLTRWVPVCGFARGGLVDLIHPSLILDPIDPIGSLFRIISTWDFPLLGVSDLAYDTWIERLRVLTDGVERILLISDYTSIIGWAEQYVHDLAIALHSIGKEVDIYGYEWEVSRWMRIWLMCLTPIAAWRGRALSQKIKQYQPDLIWMHSVLRYIWPYGIRAISRSTGRRYITHHDLGLISLHPSRIYSEWDIPLSPSLGDWVARSPVSIVVIFAILGKWLTISAIWYYLNIKNTTHIIPSLWMQSYMAKYSTTIPILFSHTSQRYNPVKL
jgi:glycosyltransferase involved in cell wall biosynthesis